MNGRSLPCAHSGQTFSRNAAMIDAFCATLRDRSVDPVTVRCLRCTTPKSASHLGAAHQRDEAQPPLMRQQVELARDIVAAHHVQDRIDAASARGLLAHRDKILGAIVDGDIGAELAARRALRIGAGGRQHRAAERLGKLDRGDADAAGPPWIRNVSPGCRCIRSNTLVQTVQNVSGRPPASITLTPEGTGRHCTAGTAAYSP